MTGVTGMLMPALSNQFQVRFDYLDAEMNDLIARSITSIEMNLLENTILVRVVQPEWDCGMLYIISSLCRNSTNIEVIPISGHGEDRHHTVYSSAVVTEHLLKLDYAVIGPAIHVIKFKFDQVEVVHFDEPA